VREALVQQAQQRGYAQIDFPFETLAGSPLATAESQPAPAQG
jgi:hypothetical protein